MIFCEECGAPVRASAYFCRQCGAAQTDRAAATEPLPERSLAEGVPPREASQGAPLDTKQVLGAFFTGPLVLRNLFSVRVGFGTLLIAAVVAYGLQALWKPLGAPTLFVVFAVLWLTAASVPGYLTACPRCGKRTKVGRSVCHHCGFDLGPDAYPPFTVPRWVGLLVVLAVFAWVWYDMSDDPPDINEASEVASAVAKEQEADNVACQLVGEHEFVGYIWNCGMTLRADPDLPELEGARVDYCYATDQGYTDAVEETNCGYGTPEDGGKRLDRAMEEPE